MKYDIKEKDIKKYSAKELACQVSTVSQRTEFLFDFAALQVVMMGRMCRQHRLQEDTPKAAGTIKNSNNFLYISL